MEGRPVDIHKQDKDEEPIEKINNRSQPVMTVGKVSGSAAIGAIDFASLMAAHKKHGGANKSHNYKEAKKANIRRNEKNQREYEKAVSAKMEEIMEQERKEWAPKDKEDAKFQKKMAEKI
eukprot:CAMPEP_0168618310 /NCGR_PEP_ID=MMETSP0449_2-20121227/6006_1 /TAXON_ID=1082188 /ORGANISM="Strombidium rassoulzadegani, Strain ras09" /LENGTH=119 /DNA_ID=CAMNT_0008659181 /DNA_START=101 /DNA_END=460 /DNA_ORIENTATION=+